MTINLLILVIVFLIIYIIQFKIHIYKYNKYLNLEKNRLLKESEHQRQLRSKSEDKSSQWPEYMDGQAEGTRQAILALKRIN